MANAFSSHKVYCYVVCATFLMLTTSINATQRQPSFPTHRRKLPSLIVTRDSIRHRPSFYGAHGSTAAEFVVSAGLDTSKSAVRIRRLRELHRNLDSNNTNVSNSEHSIKRSQRKPMFSPGFVTGSGVTKVEKYNSKVLNPTLETRYSDTGFDNTRKHDLIEFKFDSTSVRDNIQYARHKRQVATSAGLYNIESEDTGSETTSRSHLNDNETEVSIDTKHVSQSFLPFETSESGRALRFQRQSKKKDLLTLREHYQTDDNSTRLKMSNVTTPLIRQLIMSHLMQGVLNWRNISSHSNSKLSTTTVKPSGVIREGLETLTPAEQRQYGIVVNPYQSMSSTPPNNKAAVPVIRVLKGKLVPLPQLPSELIPIILGNFNPSYTLSADPKLTDSIIDQAIYTLLQNEDLLNLGSLVPPTNTLQIANKANRKSPSTNFVGSVKIPEHTNANAFRPGNFRGEWKPGPRCDRLTEEICLDDSDYPSSAIMSTIYKDKAKFDLMYAEIKERESQVDGLSRKQEQSYTFDHYFGNVPQASEGTMHPRDYGPQGGFVCPSEVYYGRPHRAKNRKGEWKVVVNVVEYTQTLRMEKCLSSSSPCKYVVSHMQSTCSQVYNYHRLLVFSKEQGLHIDAFRVPSACTCHLRGQSYRFSQPQLQLQTPYRGYEEFGGHVESAPSPQLISEGSSHNKKNKNSFSNTLWAILGGGQQAGILAQSPQFLDEVQKQISWTQQLNQFPQYLKQVSPAQVLKQLLEEDDEEAEEEDEDFRTSIRRQPIRKRHPYGLEPIAHGAFSSYHTPVAVPFREPTLPFASSEKRNTRPIKEHKPIFPISTNQKNIFQPPDNQQKVFSVPNGHRTMFSILSDDTSVPLKIQPGMYLSGSSKIQFRDSSLVPVSPHLSEAVNKDTGFRPFVKLFPSSEDSKSGMIDDGDLTAVEKSEGDTSINAFHIQTIPSSRDHNSGENESKINFSYHPILEYLSLTN